MTCSADFGQQGAHSQHSGQHSQHLECDLEMHTFFCGNRKTNITVVSTLDILSGTHEVHTSFCGNRKRRSSVLVPTKLTGRDMSLTRAVTQLCGISLRLTQLYNITTLPCRTSFRVGQEQAHREVRCLCSIE